MLYVLTKNITRTPSHSTKRQRKNAVNILGLDVTLLAYSITKEYLIRGKYHRKAREQMIDKILTVALVLLCVWLVWLLIMIVKDDRKGDK